MSTTTLTLSNTNLAFSHNHGRPIVLIGGQQEEIKQFHTTVINFLNGQKGAKRLNEISGDMEVPSCWEGYSHFVTIRPEQLQQVMSTHFYLALWDKEAIKQSVYEDIDGDSVLTDIIILNDAELSSRAETMAQEWVAGIKKVGGLEKE